MALRTYQRFKEKPSGKSRVVDISLCAAATICLCRPTLKKVMNSSTATRQRLEKVAFPVWLLQQTCPYLSTATLSTICRSMDGQQQQEGFAKLLLDSRASISHNTKYNYANLLFQWVQHKIMALIYTLTSSKCFVCKSATISRMECGVSLASIFCCQAD